MDLLFETKIAHIIYFINSDDRDTKWITLREVNVSQNNTIKTFNMFDSIKAPLGDKFLKFWPPPWVSCEQWQSGASGRPSRQIIPDINSPFPIPLVMCIFVVEKKKLYSPDNALWPSVFFTVHQYSLPF